MNEPLKINIKIVSVKSGCYCNGHEKCACIAGKKREEGERMQVAFGLLCIHSAQAAWNSANL